MNKRIFSALLAVILLLAISANANAAVKSVKPSLSLSFSGSTANCSAVVRESGKQINVTMELWHGNTLLESWSGSGTNYAIVRGNYYGVQSGDMYTLKARGTVGGVSFTAVPISNPDRRGAFGGNQVTVHDYTQWGSEDISISFN